MSGLLTFLGRGIAWGVFWVFALSIIVNDRPAFNFASAVIVKNRAVQAVDEKLGEWWDMLSDKISTAVNGENDSTERF
jgi:hypothetical protein